MRHPWPRPRPHSSLDSLTSLDCTGCSKTVAGQIRCNKVNKQSITTNNWLACWLCYSGLGRLLFCCIQYNQPTYYNIVHHSRALKRLWNVAWIGCIMKFNSLPPQTLTYGHATSSGPVTTWMGDRLRAGKPSRYVASHLGQLSLPSIRGR